MANRLKTAGSAFVLLAFISTFAALWGTSVERDLSVWGIVGFFAALGLGLFAWGTRLERSHAAKNNSVVVQIPIGWQLVSALVLVFQLITAVVAINFGIVIGYGVYKGKFGILSWSGYFLTATALYLLAGWARRKLLVSGSKSS